VERQCKCREITEMRHRRPYLRCGVSCSRRRAWFPRDRWRAGQRGASAVLATGPRRGALFHSSAPSTPRTRCPSSSGTVGAVRPSPSRARRCRVDTARALSRHVQRQRAFGLASGRWWRTSWSSIAASRAG